MQKHILGVEGGVPNDDIHVFSKEGGGVFQVVLIVNTMPKQDLLV